MSPSKAAYYTHIPPLHYHHQNQNDIVLPLYDYNPYRSRRRFHFHLIWAVGILLFLAAVYVFWPSDPVLKIERLKLNRIKVHTVPRLAIDISMFVTVRVHNTDVYSMDYKSIDVAVGYRGKKLGHVRSAHGHVKAKGSSYVDAKLEFTGIRVLSDVVYFLEDLAKGTVPFDTVSEVEGHLGLLFFDFPMEAKISCEVLVNTANQTIAHEKCLHKVSVDSCTI
ncbi:late embryogenesis abundant protein [Senna tora]|uniref:Late embryogenesis abundant protein n=1 Tax=Senna tora TaxID=362788 RepID=A0A835CHI4_9FABA|nr:late embryogenesis abundant protein [Senna tora]